MKKLKKLLSILLVICVILSQSLYAYANTNNNIDIVESVEVNEIESTADIEESDITTEINNNDDFCEESTFNEVFEITPTEYFEENFEYDDEPEYDIFESENPFVEENLFTESIKEETEVELSSQAHPYNNAVENESQHYNDEIKTESEEINIATDSELVLDEIEEETEVEADSQAHPYKNTVDNESTIRETVVEEINKSTPSEIVVEDIDIATPSELELVKNVLYGAANVSSAECIIAPTKRDYIYGEKIDLSGLKIRVVYDDNSSEEVIYSNANKSDFTINYWTDNDVAEATVKYFWYYSINYKGVRIDNLPDHNANNMEDGYTTVKINISNTPDAPANEKYQAAYTRTYQSSDAKWVKGDTFKNNFNRVYPLIKMVNENNHIPLYYDGLQGNTFLPANVDAVSDFKMYKLGYLSRTEVTPNTLVEDNNYILEGYYRNKFFSFIITINEDDTVVVRTTESRVDSISIFANPNKSNYIEGETFDPRGLVLRCYEPDYREMLMNYDVDGSPYSYQFEFSPSLDTPFTKDMTSINVTFRNKSIDVPIKVMENTGNIVNVKFDYIYNDYPLGRYVDLQVPANSTIILPQAKIFKGYVFNGFRVKKADGSYESFNASTVITSDITIEAHWTNEIYKVYVYGSLDDVGYVDKTKLTLQREYGTELVLANTKADVKTQYGIEKYGYRFKGWYVYNHNKRKEDQNGPQIKKINADEYQSFTIYPKWEAAHWQITYDYDGGVLLPGFNLLETEYFSAQAGIGLVALPSASYIYKSGYVFKHWLDVDTNETISGIISKRNERDFNLKAIYEAAQYKSMTIENNSSSRVIRTSYAEGEKFDPTNMVLKVTFENSSETMEVNYNDDTKNNFTFTPSLNTALSKTDNKITVRFEGLTADLNIQVTGAYSITYNMNGGEWETEQGPTVRPETQTTSIPSPIKVGNNFAGWYENADFSGSKITSIASGTKRDIVLYAKWTENRYMISYISNGGAAITGYIPKYARNYSEEAILPTSANYVKKGYEFAGWYEDSSFTGTAVTVVLANTMSDKTFYAKWTEKSYNVTYNLNGGQYVAGFAPGTTRRYSQSVTLPTSTQVTKEGVEFGGWYDNPNFTGSAITQIAANVDSDKEVYAKWEENRYTITYNNISGVTYANGYTLVVGRYYSQRVELPTSAQIIKAGYEFGGWYEDSSFTGNAVTEVQANTDANKTFYAKWTEKSFSITYNENGGQYVDGYTKTQNRLYSQSVTLPTSTQITKEGFKLLGWYDNSSFTGTALTQIAKNTNDNKTVYAKWQENSYTITYNANGGSYTSGYSVKKNRLYSESATLPTSADITKNGNDFGGWYENNSFTGSSVTNVSANTTVNKTFYAKWNPKTYTVSFNITGATIDEGEFNQYTYGTQVNLPTKITVAEDGKVFDGWYLNNNFTGSKITRISNTDYGDKVFYGKIQNKSTPTQRPTGGGGRSGGGGGGGGGGGAAKAGSANNGLLPFLANQAPQTINVIHYRNLANQVNGNASAFSKDETNAKWKLNYLNNNGQILTAKSGFYTIKKTVSQMINNVPTWVNEESTYYFDDTNYMVTGFVKTPDNKTYFFEHEKNANEGKMVTGWKQIQGSWYYFNVDGSMLINSTTPDGYRVGADGKLVV